jgi:molybdate/tungstate transport system substrate-binding protein
LVIGYNPHSRFAKDLTTHPWYQVLGRPGIRIGVTDPTLDPKGKLTVAALHAAESAYGLPDSFASSIQHKADVFPEEDLVGRLQAGQLDAGFFYTNEATPAGIPTVSLGRVHEAATFTVTVLNHATDAPAGAAFVRYLLTTARPTLRAGGLKLTPFAVSGDRSAVPSSLRELFRS